MFGIETVLAEVEIVEAVVSVLAWAPLETYSD